MKKFILSLQLLIIPFYFFGQLVVTDPPMPISTESVTITFDATQGSAGLAGYTGDVYAHTGVITQLSSGGFDWKYVKTSWGQNTPDTKLQRIGQDLYSLQVTPNIQDYYGVPANEKILQMAFVFRSGIQVSGNWLEGKTETDGDIFIDVYEAGLSVSFGQPQQFPVIIQLNESFITEVNANEADSVFLFMDGNLLKADTGNYLIDTITATDFGKFLVKTMAKNQTGAVADSFYYHVRPDVTVEALPAGIRDGINYTGSQSVVMSLFAPYKDYIYVIGDFNDWDISQDYYMKLTPDSLRYWVEINGLVPGKEYVFQYYIDGQIKVGDPYGDKVSDPWNDAYISDITYPNLIQYPAGKTTGIATVLQTNQVFYNWEVDNFTTAAETDLVIYELLVRDFTSKHSYDGLIDSLDYLFNLGINAIELMPVNEFEGNSSWGYNPSFYFAPDKYYGPKNDLKRFVDECHKIGIAVFIDLVLNHSYDQSPLVQMYFDGNNPSEENPWYNVNSNFTNPDAQWGNDFNHESLYTQELVDSINSYWMSEYKIDGFRFDFTKGFGNNIKGSNDPWGSIYDADRIRLLKRMADEIWLRNPQAIVIFEHLADNTEEKELADYGILLWGNANYNYGEAAMAYHDGGKSDFSWINYKKRTWNDPHVVGYMESHDEERLAFKCVTYGNSTADYNIKDTTTAFRRLAMNALFFFTVPGPKMIWQFGEMGYDYSIEYNGRLGEKPVRWDYLNDFRRKYLYDFYGALIKLRTEHPAFETATFTLYVEAALKKIVLAHPDMNVVVLGNFDVNAGTILPGFAHTGAWYEYFTGQPFEVTDLAESMSLEAGEYKMYTDIQLETPQIHTGLAEDIEKGRLMRVFPNPSDDFSIQIELEKPSLLTLEIFDLSGRKVDEIYNGRLQSGSHQFGWSGREAGLSPGIYLLRAVTANNSEVLKLIYN
ncbi:MAG: alpha-amylase family glycosyl hydrolase [Bacteroidales bacterium]|nr:alpha-amylase family glycosyl hydrolase [Bacteroidales bacterium]